jgi:lysophospholipase L1-like esterase
MRKIRLLALLLIGAVLIAGAWVYRNKLAPRPIGSGSAGPTVSRDDFSSAWTDRKVLLLGVGDSVTAGFGVPMDHTYFEMLLKNPTDDDPALQEINLPAVLPNLKTQNIAMSGSTSITHLDIVQERLESQPADVFGLVVMTSGGNDLIHNYGRSKPREGAMYGATLDQARPWIDNYENRLNQIIDIIEQRFPGGCMIFLADIYDPSDGVGDAQNAGLPRWPDGVAIQKAYNAAIYRTADKHKSVHIVPMYEMFLGHGIHCTESSFAHYRPEDPYYWYASNLEDPNARGYDAIRRLFLIEIAKQAKNIAGNNSSP